MSKLDFGALTLEYQAEGIGEKLYGFIWEIVERAIRNYPPILYSPNGIWDEDAIGGLCHDFIVEKLLGAGWIEHYLLSLETLDQLRHVLQRDFRHFLINRRRKDEFQNLVRRVKQILSANSKFVNCVAPNIWGLSEWNNSAGQSEQRLDEVVQAMYKTSLPPMTRYSIQSRKVSHLISNKNLERLLVETVQTLGLCVDFTLLIQALRYRLNILDIQDFSLDDSLNLEGDIQAHEIISFPSGVQDGELLDIAQRIYAALSLRQRQTLSAYLSLENPTLEKVSEQLRVSKSTVDNDLKKIQSFVIAAEVTEAEASKLFELLSKLNDESEQKN